MKVMRKERIIAKDHGEYVRAERNVLTAVFHPYIVTLRCSFQVCVVCAWVTLPLHLCFVAYAPWDISNKIWCLQTSSKLYLVLDFINGGHLFFQLYRQVLGLIWASCRQLCGNACTRNGLFKGF